ncbi:hypothetical protein GWI33_023381 [Rhynchophorus ferrugineus]|uniref:Uncharacterized protein n=1 Tax=Rhynchophorus ferrugineus TaxID=354439 RepID=A0A834MKJ4_RHYFE|nr:hypothetical protein GWI33_023381 [Rhynchophorus ferrugineus]
MKLFQRLRPQKINQLKRALFGVNPTRSPSGAERCGGLQCSGRQRQREDERRGDGTENKKEYESNLWNENDNFVPCIRICKKTTFRWNTRTSINFFNLIKT